MNRLKFLFGVFGLLLALTTLGAAQAALTQTSISSALSGQGQAGYSGISTPYGTTVYLASVTNVNAANNGQPQTVLYVDGEAMGVLTVNSTTKAVTVLRGQYGTKVFAHASGAMVLVGQTSQFQAIDPPVGAACTAASTVATPWVNVNNGNQWLCSSVTGTWVPGWGNGNAVVQPTAAVASAAGLITPSGPLFHITGTAAITGFNIPVGFSKGDFCVIPDGVFTTTTANNIAIASTAVVSKVDCWTYDQNTAKFYPSY